jgi:hypothetical protein
MVVYKSQVICLKPMGLLDLVVGIWFLFAYLKWTMVHYVGTLG